MDENNRVCECWFKAEIYAVCTPKPDVAYRECSAVIGTLTNLDARVDEFFGRGGEELLMRLGDVQMISLRALSMLVGTIGYLLHAQSLQTDPVFGFGHS